MIKEVKNNENLGIGKKEFVGYGYTVTILDLDENLPLMIEIESNYKDRPSIYFSSGTDSDGSNIESKARISLSDTETFKITDIDKVKEYLDNAKRLIEELVPIVDEINKGKRR